ncbi:hypothetical protein IT418_03555 [bacterium]|nr:hypothetical protein [bacterium]
MAGFNTYLPISPDVRNAELNKAFTELALFKPRILINHPPGLREDAKLITESLNRHGIYPIRYDEIRPEVEDRDFRLEHPDMDDYLSNRYDFVIDMFSPETLRQEGKHIAITRGAIEAQKGKVDEHIYRIPIASDENVVDLIMDKNSGYLTTGQLPFAMDSAETQLRMVRKMLQTMKDVTKGGKWEGVLKEDRWMLDRPFVVKDFAGSVRYSDSRMNELFSAILVVRGREETDTDGQHAVHDPEQFVDFKITDGRIQACCAGCSAQKQVLAIPRNDPRNNNGVIIISGEPCQQKCGKSLAFTYNQNTVLRNIIDKI